MMRVSPSRRGTFSCLPKRKYPKRKAPAPLVVWRRFPALLAKPGVARNSEPERDQRSRSGLPRTGRAPFTRFGCGTRRGQRSWGTIPQTRRRCRASQLVWDRASRIVELDLLAGRRSKSCEFGERPNRREAQGKAAKRPCKLKGFDSQTFGAAFLLGTLSLAEQRKVPRREGETRAGLPHKRKNLDPGFRRDDEKRSRSAPKERA